MGNRQAGPAAGATGDRPAATGPDDRASRIQTVLKHFYTNKIQSQENGGSLQQFVTLFPVVPEFASLMFHYFLSESGQEDENLSEAAFVRGGCRLIEAPPGTPQLQMYYTIFSQRQELLKKDSPLLECCYNAAAGGDLGLQTKPDDNPDTFLHGMANSLFGSETEVTWVDFSGWCGRHCPNVFSCLHAYITDILLGVGQDAEQNATSVTSHRESFQSKEFLLTSTMLWGLTSRLSQTFFPLAGDNHLQQPFISIVEGGWSLLYSSNKQGLSVRGFQHHVYDYKGPSLLLLAFGDHVYCVAIDTEWRESSQRWGGGECVLLQMSPQFKTVQAGADMVYLNINDRTATKGLQLGKSARTTIITVDDELNNVTHYGVSSRLEGLEVWGCGSPAAREAQLKQKQWEQKEAQRSKDRKLTLEDWKDNPDREILNMGGVQTEHAER